MRHAVSTLALILLICSAAEAERVVFNMISGANSANDMSPDGRFIVGEVGNPFPIGTYLLDRVTGVMTDLSASGLGLSAVAVSDDGSVVVGDIPDPDGIGINVAGRWTAATDWQSLGALPNAGMCPSRSDSYEVSADGSVVVGLSFKNGCQSSGFRWTQATGMQELQNLANGVNRASVVSADGNIIGGFAQGSFSRTPVVWYDDLSGELLDPPNGDFTGEIHGIRDDGSLLLGTWGGASEVDKASIWRADPTGWEQEQIAGGSALPGWEGIPQDIADNGTIVGFDFLVGNRRAWIQPNGEGPLLDLRNYFTSKGATIPQGMILEVAQAISADGHFIIGHGFGTGAWLATILSDCDFDGDVQCNIDDLDALVMAISSGSTDPLYDLTDDGLVNLDDRDAWLVQAAPKTWPRAAPTCWGTPTSTARSTVMILLSGTPASSTPRASGPWGTSMPADLRMARTSSCGMPVSSPPAILPQCRNRC